MSDVVIKVENLWKEYRLGTVTHHSMAKDLQSWWARVRGKEDPNACLDSTIQPFNLSTGLRFTIHSSRIYLFLFTIFQELPNEIHTCQPLNH